MVDGITVNPRKMLLATAAKPKMKLSNRTIGETQTDTRIRRLIPYTSYYNPGDDYSYNPMEFLSLVNKYD